MTEIKKTAWVFYDGECAFCVSLATRTRPFLERHRIGLAPLQGAKAERIPAGERALDEIKVMTQDGTVYGGADALLYLARLSRWGAPLRLFAKLPGGRAMLRWGYRRVAASRGCLSGRCGVSRPSRIRDFLPLALLPLGAIVATWSAPPWLMMWATALAIFAGCKWITLREQPPGCPFRAVAYLFLWPGMDARCFLNEAAAPPAPTICQWAWATLKTLSGCALLWGGVRYLPPLLWLQAWVGMVSIIFILHFGLFHLVALAWQRLGVEASPIMRCPLLATSLSNFWGQRWNRGFHDLALRYLFRPLQPRVGLKGALLLTFFASGVVHEAVITLPAREGYGLPTLYFMLQGCALLAQRMRLGGNTPLAHGWKGRVFTIAAVAVPAWLLFPAPFLQRVILPFLHAVHAL